VLRAIIDDTPRPPDGNQLRIAVIHHHLRAPSLREELKPFTDGWREQLQVRLPHVFNLPPDRLFVERHFKNSVNVRR
jgi:hypothetical protein